MLAPTAVAIVVLACIAGKARAQAQTALPYEYALGAAPIVNFSESQTGGGVVADLELALVPVAPIFRASIHAATNEGSNEDDGEDSLQREVGITVEPGVRYYQTSFADSWWIAGSVMIDLSRRSYRLANGDTVQRSWESVGAHVAGGYRWQWPSRFYVLLGTGPVIPIYDHFDEARSGMGRTEIFFGAWDFVGMSAVGVLF